MISVAFAKKSAIRSVICCWLLVVQLGFIQLLLSPLGALAAALPDPLLQVSHLLCEGRQKPLGIDVKAPCLSWQIETEQRGARQTFYHILVSSSTENLALGKADLWDSGKIRSDSSINVVYRGKGLKSRNRCYWKVKIWSNKGESNWSDVGYWSVGLLNASDWKGRWIGMDYVGKGDSETQFSRLSARYFRKEFKAVKPIKTATAYIIGLGLYELYINGHKIGDQVLAPGPTDYNKSIKYNTFDVTSSLVEGENAIGTMLGNGRFYTMRQAYKPYKIKTFGYPKILFNLDIEYTDGTRESVSTNDSWKMTANGPLRSNNEYDGEAYNAMMEMPGWTSISFDDKNWQKADYVQEPAGIAVAQMNENMKVMDTVRPVSLKKIKPGTYMLDMGQNIAGWIRFAVSGKAGQTVQLRFAETLTPSGELFTRNLRDAKATDTYTLKGKGRELWEPSFVYHGFRYVEISGYPGTPSLKDFTGCVVYDNLRTTGQITTSNPTLNQIYQNVCWGINSNYKGMPVDCPQRNERQPWLGDRTTGAYGESFIFDNVRLYTKWLDDIEEAQKPDGSIPDVAPAFWRYYSDNVTWPATYLTISQMLYQQFGDARPLIKHYPSMKKWMAYMKDNYMEDGIISKDKYGDWCVPPEAKEMIFSKDPARKTDGALLATATYYRLLGLMKDFALLQSFTEDARAYKTLAEEVKVAFNKKFLLENMTRYSNNAVTANLLPLSFGLVPEGKEESIFKQITDKIELENNGHISTGVIGTQWLMRGLSGNGRPDLAYRLATNRSYPSWGYMAENGATTIWELWNGNTADPGMNSQNHVMLLGDLMIWYYENLAGIKAASPGFKEIVMKPDFIKGLTEVDASYQSGYGLIKSSWKNTGNNLSWKISIPANTSAKVFIPVRSEENLRESGQQLNQVDGLKVLGLKDNMAMIEIGSGEYHFTEK